MGYSTLVAATAGLTFFYLFSLAVYRLYFSRVAHIPGPRLAALTYYYQSYWDVYPNRGQFLFHCIDLHKKYGPIIRIGPDEVHINDPEFYDECYPTSTTRKRDKSPLWFGWIQGTGEFGDGSTFTTIGHDLHRWRRSSIAPFFSKRMVQRLEPRVGERVSFLRQKLAERADKAGDGQNGDIVDMNNAMSGLTLDVISDYAFGKPIDALSQSDMAKPVNDMLRQGVTMHPFARTFPSFMRAMLWAPDAVKEANPMYGTAQQFQSLVNRLCQAEIDKTNQEDPKTEGRSVIQSILQNPEYPAAHKEPKRISAEGMILIGAGTETTGRTLATTMLHVLLNSNIHDKLLAELKPLMPSFDAPLPEAHQLEALPYLSAVVSEGLRFAHGVPGRLSRVAPEEDLVYNNTSTTTRVVIPRGATFSQSSYLVHMNESIYPNAHEFRPERFLAGTPGAAKAKANLMPFGKGSRSCPGLNLAYSELYMTIAALVAGLKMKLADGITAEDGRIVREFFVGCVSPESKGIQVQVLGKR